MKIVVASTNPVKIRAAAGGFQKMFPDQPVDIGSASVSSGVSSQPMTDAETLRGAVQRAQAAALHQPDADFWVGIEGGLEPFGTDLSAFAWVVVGSRDRLGKGRTGAFLLPQKVADLVRAGKEMGEADDIIFQRSNSKQENGAVGILTGDVMDRTVFYETAVILALIPFRNQDLYPPQPWYP